MTLLEVQQPEVQNWFGDVVSHPRVVVEVRSVEEIVAVLKDHERYPTPVRAVGSNHSTTACGVAEGGTLVVMRNMDRVIEIRNDTVTAQAGALYIDVNQELQKRNLQFFVNLELGNLTIGSAATGGTKDASMPGEFGQVASYAVVIKMVSPDGNLLSFTEDDPELLQVARSSYGLLGIVYEVTFRVRQLQALQVYHQTFSLDEFARQLPELKARGESMMLYINPFLDSISVEFRRYRGPARAQDLSSWQWNIRDFVWSRSGPLFAHLVSTYVPFGSVRGVLIDFNHRLIVAALRYLIRGRRTLPQAQQIRYPAESGTSRYTFSIWASPEATYIDALRAYFAFSRDYYARTGYRVDLLSVGYRIAADQSSLLSYSFDGPVMTFDPCSTGNDGWERFLHAYNELCSGLGSAPLFNQTAHLTRQQAVRAFGDRLARFETYRKRFDPGDRMLNSYFRNLLTDG